MTHRFVYLILFKSTTKYEYFTGNRITAKCHTDDTSPNLIKAMTFYLFILCFE